MAAMVMLWAWPAAAWTWADLRAALPPEVAWSAAQETPEAAEGIVLRGPGGTLHVARWTRTGAVDMLDDVRVENASGDWIGIGRLEMEGLDSAALLRVLSMSGPDLLDLLRATAHREVRAIGVASSVGISFERFSSAGLTEEGVWEGGRIEGLLGVWGPARVSVGLVEVRGLDVRSLLVDPMQAARRLFGLVSVRLEDVVATAEEEVMTRLERFAMTVGRAEGRWSRLETEVVGLTMVLPQEEKTPEMEAVLGETHELRLDVRHLQVEAAPGQWRADGRAVVAGQAGLRWRIDADAPEGFESIETVALRALHLEVEDLGIGARLDAAGSTGAADLRRAEGEIGTMLRGWGVPTVASAEMSAALSAVLTGRARSAWVEGRVEAPVPIGRLMQDGPNAMAIHVSGWTWRTERRP